MERDLSTHKYAGSFGRTEPAGRIATHSDDEMQEAAPQQAPRPPASFSVVTRASLTPERPPQEDPAEARARLQRNLDHVFNPFRDLHAPITYREDGDLALHSETALRARAGLAEHPLVAAALEAYLGLFPFGADGTMQKQGYLDGMLRVARVLLGPSASEAETRQILEEDWAKDAEGRAAITRLQMRRAAFEMADVWTPDIDPQQYSRLTRMAEFFAALVEKVAAAKQHESAPPRTS